MIIIAGDAAKTGPAKQPHLLKYAFLRQSDGQFTKVPGSHDCEKNGPPVPEPGQLTLLGLGLLGAAAARRKMK